jgi:hypothetical protein
MNSSDNFAPLTLLTGHQVSDLVNMLCALVAEDSEIALAEAGAVNGKAFEIVYSGVTFLVAIKQEMDDLAVFKKIFCNLDPAQIRCGLDISLGSHVAGGERVPAIVQALLAIARKIGGSCAAVAAVWRPANIVTGFEYFEEAVADYLAGGAFPVLAMVNFKSEPNNVIATTGLAILSGQELRIECGVMTESEMMRRVVRVVHDIATNGPVLDDVSLEGLEPSEKLKLEPVPGTALVAMTTCSILDA